MKTSQWSVAMTLLGLRYSVFIVLVIKKKLLSSSFYVSIIEDHLLVNK